MNSAAAPQSSNTLPASHPANPTGFVWQLVAKEIRLQQNNILLTLGVFLLGVIWLSMINSSDQNIVTFSPEEIRQTLFLVVLLPMLVVVLPIMFGSTAAAAEKPLGVLPWESALPVSLTQRVLIKLLTAAALTTISAGVIPYLLHRFIGTESNYLARTFRHLWPGWLGLLCTSIGFYAGTFSRDDYHGLLLAVAIQVSLGYILTVADPGLDVFLITYNWMDPWTYSWLVALRLLLIGTAFIGAGIYLMREPDQHPWSWFLFYLVLIILGAYCLTWLNAVIEFKH